MKGGDKGMASLKIIILIDVILTAFVVNLVVLYFCKRKIGKDMRIAIGNDHAGTEYKLAIIGLLKSMHIDVHNHGTDGTDSVDYPDFVHPVAREVSDGTVKYGIVICGSGNGASMTANKYPKIRCALCWTKEIVELAREHNNANILSLPARFIALSQALEMVQVFLQTEFAGGRHERRIEKIPCE